MFAQREDVGSQSEREHACTGAKVGSVRKSNFRAYPSSFRCLWRYRANFSPFWIGFSSKFQLSDQTSNVYICNSIGQYPIEEFQLQCHH